MTYRDRRGEEIDLLRWADLWQDAAYRIVVEDRINDTALVRTVWEGIDVLPGAMYATGVSPDGGMSWHSMQEAARTETEARAQHQRVLADLTSRHQQEGSLPDA